jgi:hypothetical protein
MGKFEPDTTLQADYVKTINGTDELGEIQTKLRDLGFYKGKIDKTYGPRTQAAWDMYRDLMDDGILNNRKYTVGTNECAEFSNNLLRDAKYGTYGNAWNLNNAKVKYSGYDGLDAPTSITQQNVLAYNRAAANNLANNFNADSLNQNQDYAVNMYYATSPNWKKAWENSQQSGTHGTHTGILRYNKNDGNWYVMHNIHGKVYTQKLNELMGGKGNIGITSILKAQNESLFNKAISAAKRILF